MGNRSRPIHTFQGGEEANEVIREVDIADLSADTDYYVPMHCDAELVKMYSAIDAGVSSADVTITASIGGVAVTGGAITITQSGSAAGDVDEATPSGANVVLRGQAVKLAVAGGGSGGTPRGHVTLVFKRIGKGSGA